MVEQLYAPWRLSYVSSADTRDRTSCIFCTAFTATDDLETFTLWRRRHSFALLNLYPYTSGHCMVAPIRHAQELDELDDVTLAELMSGARDLVAALRIAYRPHGFNVGFNVGEAAGAGIEEHLHLHVVPRWRGDTNMMTAVGGVRVIPEAMGQTYERLRAAMARIRGNR